jgi:hypothetical protein
MRERLAKEFDRVWIDNLNGSKFETGKVAPDGGPDPSVFSTESNHEGIQVGTAIALLAKSGADKDHLVRYRDLWGTAKRELLGSSLDDVDFDKHFVTALPSVGNRFSFRPLETSASYDTWAALPQIASLEPFSGALEMRRGTLLSLDRVELADRMERYLDPGTPIADLRASGTGPVRDMARFIASEARTRLLRVEPYSDKALRRIALHPYDPTGLTTPTSGQFGMSPGLNLSRGCFLATNL